MASLLLPGAWRVLRPGTSVRLDEFRERLARGEVKSVRVEEDRLVWHLRELPAPTEPSAAGATQFSTDLPKGMSDDWEFVQWLLDNRNGATVDAANSPVYSLLMPLVPWVLIFGLVWYITFRALRQLHAGASPPASLGTFVMKQPPHDPPSA